MKENERLGLVQDVHMPFGAMARSAWAQIKTNNTPVIIKTSLDFLEGPRAGSCSSPAAALHVFPCAVLRCAALHYYTVLR